MATVKWADASEPQRGRQGRIPYSLYSPLLVDSEQPWKVIPRNLVPINKKDKNKLIGYWNVQKRFRTRKGKRVDLSPKLHFYYLGTGPHKDAKFRERVEGVVWVAVDGAKTEPTGYGVRRKNSEPEIPHFNQKLPNGVTVVEEPDSRAPSRSQSRSQSRGRGESKPQSRNPSSDRNHNSQDDIMKAVAAALKSLGFDKPQEKDKKSAKTGTPKPSRNQSPASSQTSAKSLARSQSSETKEQKHEMQKPRWKRQPNDDVTSNVTQCFGPRDLDHNFGSAGVVANGVKAKGYPQFAELVPSTAAMLFDSHIVSKESGNTVVLTFTTRVTVPKDHPHLGKFLEELNAFTREMQQHPLLNPSALEFNPSQTSPATAEPVRDEVSIETDIIDEVN
ncbi:nucleocapsid protein [Human coronavirus 229E]|uniref:Nucleoprotein n=2 Tax=Human coronavirus 229E TaxID=11137 RepID=NCAP_CVH22|nr:nucleocapsid protein [Human coronavirus 229E]P15130.2 RecName: Full=Nucleoprotein; AltName: Full=Nucleocapsid protein; Short=NC; Short=Protein N [Human coronavirus 229E]AAG48597.1 nucleocapsid protein [Human coronavirus 229E]ABB90482.1 nucleoprotein [Human coronavirus 229E]AGW80937.1 nucleocapsid protein [Human coronavirus 229E]AGW80945.1 nucleocapsid protein [Human coronavirus 229E]UID85549.1 nucleocapsid protein [Human coronavirus 229E]